MSDKIILLVEDSPDDAALTLDAVREAELEARVAVVDSGTAALEFLFRTGPYADRNPVLKPAIMLLDLKLPGIDGLEVLRQTRAAEDTKQLPVVILTSSREASDITAAYELGANSYIRKPVDFDQFVETVKAIGNYWLTMNETVDPFPQR